MTRGAASPSRVVEGTNASPSFLADAAALDAFVEAFHACRLPSSDWTHAAHVAVCAYHAWDRRPDETVALLRPAICAYNVSTGRPNTDTSGYHETLTRFWVGVITAELRARVPPSRLEAVRAAVARFGDDRDLPRRHYSFDVVRDTTARRVWVPPDVDDPT